MKPPTVALTQFLRRTCAVGIAVAAVLWMTSCTSLEVAAPPIDKLSLPKNADRAKLAQGRQILATSCVRCHAAPRIAHHSAGDWDREILPKMTRKAKLSPTQAALLRNYVLTAHEVLAAHPQS